MNDTISREAVADAINGIECTRHTTWYEFYQKVMTAVEKLPTIHPEHSTNLASLGTDCISRQAAIDIIEGFPHGDVWNVESMEEMVDRIKQLPSAQPKMGRWIHHPEIGWGETWLCDQCGEKTTSTVMGKPRANFCPNCGAKMEADDE